jgi:hypothetical protein
MEIPFYFKMDIYEIDVINVKKLPVSAVFFLEQFISN